MNVLNVYIKPVCETYLQGEELRGKYRSNYGNILFHAEPRVQHPIFF